VVARRHTIPVLLLAIALTWVGPAPADDPEVPERYMKVDEAKALVDMKKAVTFVDVRPREQYDLLHIKGAISVPLDELPRRLDEVSRQDVVVVY
jgi:3-mercaptopyruvate sulfurtransferase SseA